MKWSFLFAGYNLRIIAACVIWVYVCVLVVSKHASVDTLLPGEKLKILYCNPSVSPAYLESVILFQQVFHSRD